MSAQSSTPGSALAPTTHRALTRATDRLLSIAASATEDAERERFKALLLRHPYFAITGLSGHYPLDMELIERFADRWDWNRLSENQALPWSLDLIERFADRWDWYDLSGNEALPWSLDLIEHFADRWDWGDLNVY